MHDTLEDIKSTFGYVSESSTLDFKSGHAFDHFGDKEKKELVKDVTAFANAAGGEMIVGVSESKEKNSNIATAFEPVTNPEISVDQLTLIIKSGTDPVFSAFHIVELALGSGRVFVFQIDQADTAHQNKHDFRYYQRTGTISAPMLNFAVRDVMNRRTRPHVNVEFSVQILDHLKQQGIVVHRIVPTLTNEGSLTAHHWSLWVDLPANAAKLGAIHAGMPARNMGNVRRRGIDYLRVELHSGPTLKNQAGTLLLPGQAWHLTLDGSFPELDLRVATSDTGWLMKNSPPVHWSFFLDDAPRKDGEIPFSGWFGD